MTSDAFIIKRSLQEAFDIPFSISEMRENGEPCFLVGPRDEDEAFFHLKISFSSHVRITLEYMPCRYSADFIRAMGHASAESKTLFAMYAHQLLDRGAKIRLLINDQYANPETPESWQTEWKSLKLRVTKAPVTENDDFRYAEIGAYWCGDTMAMLLSLANIVALEDNDVYGSEGLKTNIQSHRYERNPLNRKLCLDAKGYACQICGMDFEKTYGEIGHHFIHVHHVVPVSRMTPDYQFNPLRDLIPVCPNCHAMLHRQDPPLTPDELIHILNSTKTI